jgi:hypothetical protein
MAENHVKDTVAVETTTVADKMTSSTSNDQPTIVAATKSLDLETPSVAVEETSKSAHIEDPSITAKKPSKPASIEDLPNELLSQIFGFLDVPQPSAILHDEPIFELTDTEATNLKASSRVSKRWRRAILPLLFKHARFVVGKPEPKMRIRNLNKDIQPFLEFVNKNELLNIITTFVLVVKDRTITGDDYVPEHKLDIFANFWRSLFEAIDPIELLIIAHPEVLGGFTSCHVYSADNWNFDCPCHYLRLRRPSALLSQPSVSDEANGLPHEYPTGSKGHEVVEPANSTFSVENVAEDLLKHEPAAATVTDSIEIPQGLSESVPESSSSEPRGTFDTELEPWQILHPQTSTLFEIRPWSSLLLNEGSFIKAYSTYEFWLRQAPSVSIISRSK